MKPILKKLASALALLIWGAVCVWGQAPDETVTWKVSQGKTENGLCEIIFDGTIANGWHTYSVDHEYTPTEVTFTDPKGYTLEGGLYEILPSKELDGEHVYFDRIRIGQKIRITAEADSLKGEIAWRSCNDQFCASPEYLNFSIPLEAKEATVAPAGSSQSSGSLWGLILEAILWGVAMLLTPCVFPMIPMTISFFMKGSSTPAAGRFKAFMYGLFIVLLYTVPISAIIGITYIFGGETVTADIFNWLATHWLPNIIFFIVFMIFAASFFGAFEITLPSAWTDRVESRKSRASGIAAIFLMAFTLALVSFSCTGPIIGFLLVAVSTQGSILAPAVGMLGFAVALAVPFTLFALFPSLLNRAPRSGGWMNVIKVTLGFIELAFALKFLSVADLAYGWRILDREVFLSLWIIIFALLGAYHIGWIRFPHDEEEWDEMGEKVLHHKTSVTQFFISLICFAFSIYMIPGLWGAPCKAVSAFAPPMMTQDFNLAKSENIEPQYKDFEQGMQAAIAAGKPVMIDFTGFGCVNCRKMEAAVWTDDRVKDLINNDYVLIQLFVDDKTPLPEPIEVTQNGQTRKLRTVGDKWSYLQSTKFGAQAQPFYVLLDHKGHPLNHSASYDEDIDKYIDFLETGLKNFKK